MDFSHILDIIGQLPILKSYTHILLCFPLADPSLDSLESAVQHLVDLLPFLAGQVVHEGLSPTSSGQFLVKPYPHPRSPLRIEDRRSQCVSYETLLSAQAPSSMLPGTLLGRRRAFPESYEDSPDDPAPVLDIQANLIHGGLLLDLAAQHNIVDAIGLFQIAHLLAFVMRGEPIPQTMLDEANRPRHDLIPLLGADEPLLDHRDLRPAPEYMVSSPQPRESIGAFEWRYLHIDAVAVQRIKSLADAQPTDFHASTPFISDNDALTAFLWHRITYVRLRRLNTPQAISRISRAVDFRRVVGLSPSYLGHMVRVAFLRLTFQEVVDSSLSKLASLVRKSVLDISDMYSLRSYVTYLAREPDKSTISYGGGFDANTDLSFSSIAHLSLPEFGALGKPDLLRRPTFQQLPCSMYLAPSMRGGVEVLACLLREEMEMLVGEMGGFLNYIG
ncbi:hypothetical protein EYZ11_000402 [Aspergillus tanneri]|uniref:Trichothecene 3-O-acetyltransferase-like N-terminal domain-containing protein n=1 Tax=Aspergillus tanneri TaxID=1220188 RepID=A0A4S3JX34_9EURO|nr:uncharacterized protein ATNIH1004_006822 [Aspergillus tanneri]KAA8645403.1 hypothetical protein ATNIH1004_006822 [Aspergillus tanneri]THD00077.1 hypothetical protein EYZ11_000402 [Aspergillus tanneri]